VSLVSPRRKRDTLLRVNRSHSLSMSLLDCVIFGPAGNYGLVNLGSPNGPIVIGPKTPGGWRATVAGAGLKVPLDNTQCDSTIGASGYYWSLPNYVSYGSGAVTVFVGFVPQTWSNTFNVIFAKGVGGNYEIAVWLNNSGNQAVALVGSETSTSVFTTGYALGAQGDYAITRDGSGVMTYYANGAQIEQNGLPFGAASQATERLTLGRDAAANQGLGADYQFLYTWSRALSAAEIAQLHFDPYCFLTAIDDAFTGTLIAQAAPSTPTLWASSYGNPIMRARQFGQTRGGRQIYG